MSMRPAMSSCSSWVVNTPPRSSPPKFRRGVRRSRSPLVMTDRALNYRAVIQPVHELSDHYLRKPTAARYLNGQTG